MAKRRTKKAAAPDGSEPVAIYLIHFDRPLAHARHYLGSAADLPARLEQHAGGSGARILAVLRELGIGWRVVKVAAGTRADEARLKRIQRNAQYCPVCNPGGRSRALCPGAATAAPVMEAGNEA